ncbi:Epidermal growth factor receptor substrate 15 [Bagarius yarrelli]|uniref:Epidermal growth factor receptor substrate 15 n=1 Tax=Bagarius yarrelli TaxID=175774 RepID=A0A556V163_BAGYA|nr:Epidermal growth factor receptor substrate 15 [Bagarius yarrelli]
MMRFLLDCLRPGRQRAGCGRENSVEIPTKEKEPGEENELKDLEDVVAMEEGALQRDRVQSRDSQQALESLAKRRAQLKEEIERIQEQRKQEGQLLLSLQEEEEELEQRVQEYDAELTRAREELRRLQEEISSTRSRVEEVHGRMGSFKHCIGDTYTEITEAKQRLGELITEMIAIEACAPEVTSHQASETFRSSREEDQDAEEHCEQVYKEDKELARDSVETEASEQEHQDGPEKLQRSVENLKSSGSSSFTEITLTEFKDEDASPRSITSQHTGSADLEEEDFEIVQSLMSRPVNQSASKEFDFFQPDPFIDYDVFGDERFPKVDMTEFLSGDPFKGSDPFACDNVFSEAANGPIFQDSPLSEDDDAKESSPPPSSLDTTSTEQHADISTVAHFPISTNCSQSIDSGMFEQNVPEIADSEKNTTYVDVCSQVGIEITVTQELDNMDLHDSIKNKLDLAASPEIEDGGRFDPIVCEFNDIQESDSSSTVDSSFDGDFGMAEDHPEEEPEVEAGSSYVRRNQALYGLQRIDTSSYTSFPLSPDTYDPEPYPGRSNVDEKQSSFSSNQDTLAEIKPEIEIPEETQTVEPANPSSPNQEIHDVHSSPSDLERDLKEDHFSNTNDPNHPNEPTDTDDHKFGDIYFFTVRLDPGSSDASPVSPEASERKKCEADHTSPESVDTDEFDYGTPEYEDPMQHSLEKYPEESFENEESGIRPEQPPISPEPKEPVGLSEENVSPSVPMHQEEKPGDDPFECSVSDLESNNLFEQQFKNTENVDTNLESCNSEPVVQYLISPVSGDTEMFSTDGYKLCARNPFSFDTGSIDHYDNTEKIPEPHASETCIVKESGSSECLVLLDPVLIDNTVHAIEAKNPNADSRRLDSGYHEFSVQDPFSPGPTVSTEMDLGSVTDNPDIESNPINLDIQLPDPFSPESNDTTIFDSEPDICNAATNNELIKDLGPGCTGSLDVLADSFTGSELDSFDPFGPMPHFTASSYTYSNTDILVTGSLVDETMSYGDNRSSSWDSDVSQSPQLHCDSVPNNADPLVPPEANLVTPDSKSCSPSYTTDFFPQSESSTLTNVGSFTPNLEKIILADKNTTVAVTAMEDLAEIDFFCSELSKMVASRSSDTVQQSVTEMLFGSNPDTAKFYPWDLENSHADINETSSPENDIKKPSLL